MIRKATSFFASLIFLVVFNIIFFWVGGFNHTVAVWIAYGMVHLTYLMFIATPLFTPHTKHFVELGAPVSMLSFASFIINFIISLIVFIVKPQGFKFVLIMYIIIFAIYLVLFFFLLSVNDHTASMERRRKNEISYIQTYASRIKLLIGKLPDDSVNKKIEEAYDILHSSPTKTVEAAKTIETTIVMKIGELEGAVINKEPETAKKLATEIIYLTEERTRILQLNY